ncbi:class I adenylate-forming enzyme family protein [Lysobacter sp. A286]
MDSLTSRVAAVADATPGRTAIVDRERQATYGELWSQAKAFAALLRGHGLVHGDRVAIVLPNRIEAVVAWYGVWLAGGVVVALNVQARVRDLVPWLDHCGARFVVHERDHADALQALDAISARPLAFSLGEGDAEFRIAPAETTCECASDGNTGPDAVALILYTSGTTGAPKGVMLSHANLLANAQSVIAYLGLGQDDSVLSVLPFYYAYGASVLHTHLISGARVVLAPNLLFPHLVVDDIARERVTGFSGVPSTFALLLDHVALHEYDLSSLRYLTQAGGAMTTTLANRLRAALPHPRLFVMYGQTEATSRLTWLPPERLDQKPGSVGVPIDGVSLKILSEDGSNAATGEAGEVWVHGPNVMQGYWNNPAATAAVMRDGWLRTGDIGHLDDDGFLFLAGRRSDMIKTGAHRVHPDDIEQAIAEMEGVIEVAVVGIDDEVLGQVIKAFIVTETLPERGVERVKAHCRARLAPYKIPKHVEFVTALPHTASGKVRRIQLTEQQVIP